MQLVLWQFPLVSVVFGPPICTSGGLVALQVSATGRLLPGALE